MADQADVLFVDFFLWEIILIMFDWQYTKNRGEPATNYSTGLKQGCIPSPHSASYSNESNSLMHYWWYGEHG